MYYSSKNKGDILLSVLIFASIAITIIIGLTNWGASLLRNIRNVSQREQAFQIAEAGLDYYQWHLAQFPNDYKDGTATSGPYIHTFRDKDDNVLGTYSLTITPPPTGSTIVKIVSTGTLASSSISRTIQKTLAIPSLAKYATVSNDNLRFGSGTEVFGPIHANGGIRFDGIAHNLISSSMATYTDPDPPGLVQWAVYTTSGQDDPIPSVGPVNNRPDVFIAGRQFPIPSFDFNSLTIGLTHLQSLAQNGGKEWSSSGKQGYHMVFKVTGGVTSYDMYRVNSIQSVSNSCSNNNTANAQKNGPIYYQWGSWSIKSPITSNQTLIGNYPIPANGVIFVNDHVWVDGQIDDARITVVSGIVGSTDPTKYGNITINSDLRYTNYDGTDSIGLIAQGNVNVGMVSADTLRIDAALIAEKGRVGRFYYSTNCTDYSKTSLTLYGMIATYRRYGFSYTDGTGYETRNIIYDSNLLYAPPPSFPSASNQYEVISWQQLD